MKNTFPRNYHAFLSPEGVLIPSTIREREGDSDSVLRKLCPYRKYTAEECQHVIVSVSLVEGKR